MSLGWLFPFSIIIILANTKTKTQITQILDHNTMKIYVVASVFTMLLTSTDGSFRRSEFVVMDGHDVPESYHSPLPHT